MPESTNSESFEEIVQWAYTTLPEKIRDLPDFPGIQVVEEPPENVLKEVATKRNWPKGTEMLGLYSGIRRTEPQHFRNRIAPDLIFVFRGPILRCSKGDLRAEVKQTVWHEVAHWLGHNEEEVKELGLSAPAPPLEEAAHDAPENQAQRIISAHVLPDTIEEVEKTRCVKCYSPDVSCREVERAVPRDDRWLSDLVTVHARLCRCNSCGYEWDDEDNCQ